MRISVGEPALKIVSFTHILPKNFHVTGMHCTYSLLGFPSYFPEQRAEFPSTSADIKRRADVNKTAACIEVRRASAQLLQKI
jgi:hypothetical protein